MSGYFSLRTWSRGVFDGALRRRVALVEHKALLCFAIVLVLVEQAVAIVFHESSIFVVRLVALVVVPDLELHVAGHRVPLLPSPLLPSSAPPHPSFFSILLNFFYLSDLTLDLHFLSLLPCSLPLSHPIRFPHVCLPIKASPVPPPAASVSNPHDLPLLAILSHQTL